MTKDEAKKFFDRTKRILDDINELYIEMANAPLGCGILTIPDPFPKTNLRIAAAKGKLWDAKMRLDTCCDKLFLALRDWPYTPEAKQSRLGASS